MYWSTQPPRRYTNCPVRVFNILAPRRANQTPRHAMVEPRDIFFCISLRDHGPQVNPPAHEEQVVMKLLLGSRSGWAQKLRYMILDKSAVRHGVVIDIDDDGVFCRVERPPDMVNDLRLPVTDIGMPEMRDRLRQNLTVLVDLGFRLGSRAVVGDEDRKIFVGLILVRSQANAQKRGIVIRHDNDCSLWHTVNRLFCQLRRRSQSCRELPLHKAQSAVPNIPEPRECPQEAKQGGGWNPYGQAPLLRYAGSVLVCRQLL